MNSQHFNNHIEANSIITSESNLLEIFHLTQMEDGISVFN